MPGARRGGRTWLLCLAAPLVWFAHFSALYGGASFGTAAGMSPAWFEGIAWTLTVVACLAIVGIGAVAWRRSERAALPCDGPARGARTVAGALAGLSLVGILFQGLVLAMVPP